MSSMSRFGFLMLFPALALGACSHGPDDTQHPGPQMWTRSGPDNALGWDVAATRMRDDYEFCREQAAIVDRSQPARDSERQQCMAEHGWDRTARPVPDDLYEKAIAPRDPQSFAERGRPTSYYYKVYK